MPMTARSAFTQYRQPQPLIPNKIKLQIALLIFILSFWSGKVTFLNDLVKSHNPIPTAESAYFTSINTAEYSADINTENTPYLISQVAIGQKKIIVPTPTPVHKVVKNKPWGIAEQIDTHTYTMKVQPDNRMAGAGEILNALNDYRRRHGSHELAWDNNLANFAQNRADYFISINNLDSHKGFFNYLNNQDGFKKLGFGSIGENSSFGFTLEGVHLIEWVYAGDKDHDGNQLNNQWQYVGIGVNGTASDLVFASSKL